MSGRPRADRAQGTGLAVLLPEPVLEVAILLHLVRTDDRNQVVLVAKLLGKLVAVGERPERVINSLSLEQQPGRTCCGQGWSRSRSCGSG